MSKYLLLLVFTIYTAAGILSPINLKQSQQKCQTNSHKACHDLGYHYDQKGDPKKANIYYKKSCDLKGAKGCFKLAELYLVGAGVKQSDVVFTQYMKKACKLGHKQSCSFINKDKPTEMLMEIPKKQKGNSRIINITGTGELTIKASLVDKKKRIVEVSASMLNDFMQTTGWISFSFPQLHDNQVIQSNPKGFAKIKSYPKGHMVYNIKEKKAIISKYLLVEAEAKNWRRGEVKTNRFTLKVPSDIETLTVLIRATLKDKSKLKYIPTKGHIGQQNFKNYKINIPIEKNKNITKKTTMTTRVIKLDALTREDKLLLLDKLFKHSYFHRQREAFERQLRATLFGDASYRTSISEYRCSDISSSNTSKCTLIIQGETIKNRQNTKWEYHLKFTARKDNDGLKISDMHSLELLD